MLCVQVICSSPSHFTICSLFLETLFTFAPKMDVERLLFALSLAGKSCILEDFQRFSVEIKMSL